MGTKATALAVPRLAAIGEGFRACVRTRSFGSHPGHSNPSLPEPPTSIDTKIPSSPLPPERTRTAHKGWWGPPDWMRFSLRKIAHAAPIRRCEWAIRGSRGICSAPRMAPKASGSHTRALAPESTVLRQTIAHWRDLLFQSSYPVETLLQINMSALFRTSDAAEFPGCASGWG